MIRRHVKLLKRVPDPKSYYAANAIRRAFVFAKMLPDDRKLFQQTGVVFDGLHELLSEDVAKPRRKTKRNGRRS